MKTVFFTAFFRQKATEMVIHYFFTKSHKKKFNIIKLHYKMPIAPFAQKAKPIEIKQKWFWQPNFANKKPRTIRGFFL